MVTMINTGTTKAAQPGSNTLPPPPVGDAPRRIEMASKGANNRAGFVRHP